MDFNKIKPFYFAAKAKSFNKTSLNVSSSVISRHVSDLEKHYEVKLFYRTKSGLVLTQKGEALFKKVEFLLTLIDQSEKEFLQESNKEVSERINLIVPFHWGTRLLLPYVSKFLRENPGIRLNIITDSTSYSDVENKLVSIDDSTLTVAILPYLPKKESLIKKLIIKSDLKLYASESYLKLKGCPKTIKDLEKHELISSSQAENSSFADLDWHLKLGQQPGKQRKPILRLSDPFYGLVDGEGIGIVSLGDRNILLRSEKVRNILPDVKGPTINVYFTYSEHLRGIESIKKFCNFVEFVLKKEYTAQGSLR